jgi:hypothetical protein
MKDYMNLPYNSMHFLQFIINKDGSIAKVMSDYKSLVALAKVCGKNNSSEVGLKNSVF